ncbi:MAG: hypothetical protein ACHQ0J_15350 [Candidatus Dormibacterales bacterium]
MPLVSVTTTTFHEPFVVRFAGSEVEYTIQCGVGKQGTQTYVPIEHLPHLITAIQALDATATITSAPE